MITVVISSHNYGHLAAHAIESVLAQTRKADHILFVDDGVGDCAHLPALYPQVEFVLREKNLGVVDNFNDMLTRVQTDRVMFLGADNWLREDTLEKLDDQKADIVSYDWHIVGEGAQEFKRLLSHNQLQPSKYGDLYTFIPGDITKGNYIHGSSLYNVEIAKVAGGYERNPHSKNTEEDWMLFKKMIFQGAFHAHVPEPMLFYRRHNRNHNI